MKKSNLDIRERAKLASVRLWQIGDAMDMSDANFSRLLRKELPIEKKREIFSIIDELQEANQ